ncbi:chemotaxis response regulator protein-glutamate methylesterase [Pseudocolwellia sp. AS88]|uniref:protein-glutamate methylesterase/protein-glutamine glutaminase n=1 Tax=Pseudocolwellia sp. AS88 TaxID=3063958 RepID=UPI0026F32AFC|nr:chemotaxis response regulator protein-glutamate methylesterase [Pseudocolwellia sp. AS88]MDO7084957.1 chemotaxis response regulator protein-glutamate methylesterase [Pseudocolwellia sp. AS88]
MDKSKVLIIDDSSVIRSIIKEVLLDETEIEVVGEAKDPFVARDLIKKLNPDVLTLDVEMPKMDGITFLANLMRLRPMPVLMLSTLTTKGAEVTLKALELGAIDFIAKPSFQELLSTKGSFKETLISKIKHAAQINHKTSLSSNVSSEQLPFSGCVRRNHLVAIGASTGGTEAIKKVLSGLPQNCPPILITLHIPKVFSAHFAARMDKSCKMQVQEAKHGQKIKEGNVYIAPGDLHLKVESKGGSLFCILEDSPEVNRHKPAVDVLFNSLIPIAENTHAILLTGMGRDGAKGLLNLKENKGMTTIQTEQSSLIWGMPGAAFKLNAHTRQTDLSNIATELLSYALLDRTGMKELKNEN